MTKAKAKSSRYAVGVDLAYDVARGTLRLVAWARIPAQLAERMLAKWDVRPGRGRKVDLGGDGEGKDRRKP